MEVAMATPANAAVLAAGPLWEQLPNNRLPSGALVQLVSAVGGHTFTDAHARRLVALLSSTSHCLLLAQYLLLVKGVLSMSGGVEGAPPAELLFFANADPTRPGITCPPRLFPDKGFTFNARVFAMNLANDPRLFTYGLAGSAWVECYLTFDGLVFVTKKGDKSSSQVRIRYALPLREWVHVTVGLQYRFLGSSLLTLWVAGKQVGHASVKYPAPPKDGAAACLRLFGAVGDLEGPSKHGFRGLWGAVTVYRDYPPAEALVEDKDGLVAQHLWHHYTPQAVHGATVLDYEPGVVDHASRALAHGERGGGCAVHAFVNPVASLQRVGGASIFVLFLKRFTGLKLADGEADVCLVRDCVITAIEVICSLLKNDRDRQELLACNGFGLMALVLKTLPAGVLSNHLVKVLADLLVTAPADAIKEAVLRDVLFGVCGIRLWKGAAFETQKMLYVKVFEHLSQRTARVDPKEAVKVVAAVEENVISSRDLLKCILSLYYDTHRAHEMNANAHLSAGQLAELRSYLTDVLWWMFSHAEGHSAHIEVLMDALDAAEKDHQQLNDVLALFLRFLQLPHALATLQDAQQSLVPWLARYLSHPDTSIRMLSVKLYMAEGGKSRYEPLIAVAKGACSLEIYATLKEAATGRVTSCKAPEDVQWSEILHYDVLESLVTAVCSTTLHPAVQRRIQLDVIAGLRANPQAVTWMVHTLPTGLLVFSLARLGNSMAPLLALICRTALASPHGVRFLDDVWTCLHNLPTFGSPASSAAVAAALAVLQCGALSRDLAEDVVPAEASEGTGCVDPAVVMLNVATSLLEEILSTFTQGDGQQRFPSRYLLDAFGKLALLTREILGENGHRSEAEYVAAATSCNELCVRTFIAANAAKIDLSHTCGNTAPPPSLNSHASSPPGMATPRGGKSVLIYKVLLSLAIANLTDFLRRLSAASMLSAQRRPGSYARGGGRDGHRKLQDLAHRFREASGAATLTAAPAAAAAAPTLALPTTLSAALADYLDGKLVEMRGRLDTQLSQADGYVDSVLVLLAKNIETNAKAAPQLIRTVLCVATDSLSLIAEGQKDDPVRTVLLRLVAGAKNLENEVVFAHLQDDPALWDPVRNSDNIVAAEAFDQTLRNALPKSQKRLQHLLDDLDGYKKSQEKRVSAFHADTAAALLQLAEDRADRGEKAGGTPLTQKRARGFHLAESDFDPSLTLHTDWARMEKRVRDASAQLWWRDARYSLAVPGLATETPASADPAAPLTDLRQLKERIFWKVDPGCRHRLKRWRPKGLHAGVGEYRKNYTYSRSAGDAPLSPVATPMQEPSVDQLNEMVQQSAKDSLRKALVGPDAHADPAGLSNLSLSSGPGVPSNLSLERYLNFDAADDALETPRIIPGGSATPSSIPSPAKSHNPTPEVEPAAPPRRPITDTPDDAPLDGGGEEVGGANAALMGANERIHKDTAAAETLQKYRAWFVAAMELKMGWLDLTTRQLFFTAQAPEEAGGCAEERAAATPGAALDGKHHQPELAHSAVFCKDIVIDIGSIEAVYQRSYYLRPLALELHVNGDTRSAKTYMFKFVSKPTRDDFIRRLRALKDVVSIKRGPALSTRSPAELVKGLKITERWCKGQVSNYEYLLELNFLAGRTFCDVEQYPVFPWVLADYTSKRLDLSDPKVFRDLSKPVGALNPTRLESFKARYDSMPPGDIPPFHYGTHYSSGGAVLFYLTRVEPYATMLLTLQDGKWDHCDRMFHSVATTWRGVLEGPADVKELVPEFFTTPEILLNGNKFNFGELSSGEVMGDVVLPPWAKDAHDFIHIHRAALESQYVSANLHRWIDLIFGHAQRGAEAVKAHNVFFHLTYEGAVNWNAVSEVDAPGLEQQIQFFGQTPSQLFLKAHPKWKGGGGDPGSASKPEGIQLPGGLGHIGAALTKPNIGSFRPGSLMTPRDNSDALLSKAAGFLSGRKILTAVSVAGGAGGLDVLTGVFFQESSAAHSPLALMTVLPNLQTATFKWDPSKQKVAGSGKVAAALTAAPQGIASQAAAPPPQPSCDTVFDVAGEAFCPAGRFAMTEGGHLIMTGFYDGAVRVSLCRKHTVVADFAAPSLFTSAHLGLATVVCASKQFVAVGTSHGLVCVFVWRPPAHYLPAGNRPALVRQLRGHTGAVTAVAADADLDTLVSAAGGTVLIHSLRKGRLIRLMALGAETVNVRRLVLASNAFKAAYPLLAVLADTAKKKQARASGPVPPDMAVDGVSGQALTVATLNGEVVYQAALDATFVARDLVVVFPPSPHVLVGGHDRGEGRVHAYNIFATRLFYTPPGAPSDAAAPAVLDYERVTQPFPDVVTALFTPPSGDGTYLVGTASGQVFTAAVDKAVVHPNTVMKEPAGAPLPGKKSPVPVPAALKNWF